MKDLTTAVFDWAAEQPKKTALVYNDVGHSYRWLADAIAMTRGAFVDAGLVGPGVVVLAISNLIDFWAASLALRSLGFDGVLIPSPEVLPELGLSDIRAVITTPSETWPGLPEGCARAGVDLLVCNFQSSRPLGLADGPQRPPGGFALVTSGTTGKVKKVLNQPAWEAEFLRRRWEIIRADRTSIVAAFDLAPCTGTGYRNPAGALFAGATVVFDQGRERHLGLRWPGITHSTINPLVLAGLLAAPADAFSRNDTLRLSLTSGTVTLAQIAETKVRITPHVFNWLGATESQITGHTRVGTPDDYRWHRLLPGVQLVDENDRPVTPGQVGRLRVSTEGAPQGYWRDPGTTAEFFRGGYFYPGDLGLLRKDGRVALQGRETSVINVGGWKVSPEPIEDRLREALSVSGACLVSAPNTQGEEQIHLVIETPTPVPSDVLASALSSSVPWTGAVEVHFTRVLPRSVQGKLLRKVVTDQILAGRDAPAGPV